MTFKAEKGGYSLAEILISIVLIGVGLVAVVGIFPFGLAHIRIIGERIYVVQKAQAEMEYMKTKSYKLLMDYYTTGADPLQDNADPNYDIQMYFEPDTSNTNLLKLKVAIYWQETNPYERSNFTDKSYFLEGYKNLGTR